MSYTINLTNGNVFAVVADGTINTSSSVTLVGKNYPGWGEFFDENFVHLLENFSNNTAPAAPLRGQLWWDSGTGLLKVYNGTTFKTVSAATASATAPVSNVTGDLWYDTVNAQLKVYTGTAWLLVGPSFTAGTGVTGAVVDTIVDNASVTHVVIKLVVNDAIVGIVSKDAAFTPQTSITGFTQVLPGITLASSIAGQVPLFQGTATDAQALEGLPASSFLSSVSNDTTSGTLGILNDSGLSVGVDQDFRVVVSGTNVTVSNQTNNGNLALSVNVGGTQTTLATLVGSTGTIELSSALGVESGGTGATSLASNAVILGNATSAVQTVAPGTAGNALVSTGTTWASQSIQSFVTGMIMMWSGSIGSIPSGWALCDGTLGTPDLRDRFIVGAGSTYTVAATGGSANSVVVAHSHTITDPGHSHTYTNLAGTDPSIPIGTLYYGAVVAIAVGPGTINSNTTGISINSTGSSGTNANLPPYYALAFIMKL